MKSKKELLALSIQMEPVPVTETGIKHDDGKLPWDLVPWDAVEGAVKVLQLGANKYSPRNWEKGFNWMRIFAALMRHLIAWSRKEKADPETGLSHLDHAMCCLLFLSTFEKRGTGTDDRPSY